MRREAVRLRAEENLSTPAIARQLGISNFSVYRILRKHPWHRPAHYQGGRGPLWTQLENQRLQKLWPLAPKAEILAAFPERSAWAIQQQAVKLKIRRDSKVNRRRIRHVPAVIETLRQARLDRGMTQGEVADRAGYNRYMIGQWEIADSTPSLRQIVDWAAALDYEIVARPVEKVRPLTESAIAAPDRLRLMAGR